MKVMPTAYPMTPRASGPSLLIIEKQQNLWDEQQFSLRSIVAIKQCLHELSRRRPRLTEVINIYIHYTTPEREGGSSRLYGIGWGYVKFRGPAGPPRRRNAMAVTLYPSVYGSCVLSCFRSTSFNTAQNTSAPLAAPRAARVSG